MTGRDAAAYAGGMTPDSLRQLPDAPADGVLAALWWAARGDWDQAHRLVMADEGRDAARVHAWLHRQEGDLPNARYWYSRAGQPEASDSLDAEWQRIAGDMLRAREGR